MKLGGVARIPSASTPPLSRHAEQGLLMRCVYIPSGRFISMCARYVGEDGAWGCEVAAKLKCYHLSTLHRAPVSIAAGKLAAAPSVIAYSVDLDQMSRGKAVNWALSLTWVAMWPFNRREN